MGREMERDDLPVTLQEACDRVYSGAITPYTLIAEARRGNIKIHKIGKRYFTTLREAKELMERCPAVQEAPASISIRREGNGPSETERVSIARAALKASLQKPKKNLPNTSDQNTPRRQHQRH
jgi:hypothetical protein